MTCRRSVPPQGQRSARPRPARLRLAAPPCPPDPRDLSPFPNGVRPGIVRAVLIAAGLFALIAAAGVGFGDG